MDQDETTNPEEIAIGSSSILKKYWGQDESMCELPRARPTMMKKLDRSLLVFSYVENKQIASVFFYDVQMQKETHQFKGASMLLSSLNNKDANQGNNVYYFYADKNLATLTNIVAHMAADQQLNKQCTSPIVMATELVVDSQEDLQVVDFVNYEDSPPLTHSVSHPVVTGQPKYTKQWFKDSENTVTQFRLSRHDYFAVSNNHNGAEKMVIYKVENPL